MRELEAPASASTEPTPQFDQVIGKLRHIVAKLEQGQLPLEQALQAFEEGVRLSKQGAEILQAAEHRLEVLMQGEQGQPQITSLSLEPMPETKE